MIKALATMTCCIAIAGCATAGLSLEERTARAIGLPAGAQVTISNDSGQGIIPGHRYYVATAKNGDSYNCTIFSNLGFEDRPQCVRQGK